MIIIFYQINPKDFFDKKSLVFDISHIKKAKKLCYDELYQILIKKIESKKIINRVKKDNSIDDNWNFFKSTFKLNLEYVFINSKKELLTVRYNLTDVIKVH